MLEALPVTIVCGFLGAGKTTLLNYLLQVEHGLRVAVLVNDFGSVNIDARLISRVGEGQIELTNGCICCSIRDDLRQATQALLERPVPPEYLLVETSGVSDPAEVARTFLLPQFADRLRLDAIIAVVDAAHIATLPREQVVLAMDQVGVADIVLLNKVDLVDPTTADQAEAWVRGIVPAARLWRTVRAEAPAALLLGVGAFSTERLVSTRNAPHVHPLGAAGGTGPEGHDHAGHDAVFETWLFRQEEPLHLALLRETLGSMSPAVFRAKGFVHAREEPQRSIVAQVVGQRVELRPGEPWGGATPVTELVFIATAGGIDSASLAQRLSDCADVPRRRGWRRWLAGRR